MDFILISETNSSIFIPLEPFIRTTEFSNVILLILLAGMVAVLRFSATLVKEVVIPYLRREKISYVLAVEQFFQHIVIALMFYIAIFLI